MTHPTCRYLSPSKVGPISTTAVSSVPSPVINLQDAMEGISHDAISDAITKEFIESHALSNPEVVHQEWTEDSILAYPGVSELVERHRSWEWQYGATPAFTLNISEVFGESSHCSSSVFFNLKFQTDWGSLHGTLSVKEGRVIEAEMTGACSDEVLNILQVLTLSKQFVSSLTLMVGCCHQKCLVGCRYDSKDLHRAVLDGVEHLEYSRVAPEIADWLVGSM